MNNIISVVNLEATIIENDKWQVLLEDETCETSLLSTEEDIDFAITIVPVERVLENNSSELFGRITAISINNDTDVTQLKPWLNSIELIVLEFPKFTDGRAYTQAVELRRHLAWKGELRAQGDVLRDQLSHMYSCGFTSFSIREDKDPAQAIKGLSGISIQYANSIKEPKPLFRRR
jgi:uncharacterized protein (DUF934 family)